MQFFFLLKMIVYLFIPKYANKECERIIQSKSNPIQYTCEDVFYENYLFWFRNFAWLSIN